MKDQTDVDHPMEGSHPDTTPESSTLWLEEHKALTEIISHIMDEFWQTNAFFLSFFGVVIGAMVGQAAALEALGLAVRLSIFLLLLALAAVWLISLMRHFHYTRIHMAHAMALEAKGLQLTLYTRRVREMRPIRWPSARLAWTSVPLLIALFLVVLASQILL